MLYLAILFGARSVWQRHRTGSTGWRGVSGNPGTPGWWVGILMIAALAWLLATPWWAATATGFTEGVIRITSGIVLVVVGLSLAVWSQFHMGEAWRIGVREGERTELCTTGPFAWCRNPIFTAMLVSVLGCVVWIPWMAPAWLALGIAFELQVRTVEEPHLLATHGEDYRRYAQRTGRFWPGLGQWVQRS